jgi:hypothetical protein
MPGFISYMNPSKTQKNNFFDLILYRLGFDSGETDACTAKGFRPKNNLVADSGCPRGRLHDSENKIKNSNFCKNKLTRFLYGVGFDSH